MPRVHVQKAGKDYPEIGVKKGEVYYWWKFRYGGKRKSKTRPRPSQLTQSKMSAALAAQESMEDVIDQVQLTKDDLVSALDEFASEIESVKDEYQESLDNMTESFGDGAANGHVGEQIQEHIDGLESWQEQIESASVDVDGVEFPDEPEGEDEDGPTSSELEEYEEAFETALEEAREIARSACDQPF